MANKGPTFVERYVYLICSCRDHSHTVRASWDIKDTHPTNVWISVSVKSEPNLLKRLKNAFNYLLGRPLMASREM